MAQLIIDLPSFSLVSKWRVYLMENPTGSPTWTHTTPSLVQHDQTLDLSGLPAGATINNAILHAERGSPRSGASVDKINDTVWDRNLGGWTVEEDLTSLVRNNFGGTITLNYKFMANGDSKPPEGEKRGALSYNVVKVIIDYTPGKSNGQLDKDSVTASGSDNVSINISPHNNRYSHNVHWYINGQIASKVTQNIPSGILQSSFSPPIDWCNFITTSSSAIAYCELETLNGSSSLGSNSYSFMVHVPNSLTPAVSIVIEPVDTLNGTPLQGISRAKITATAQGVYGSSIDTYSFYGGGYSSNADNPWLSGILPSAGETQFTCTVIDSRGRQATATGKINVEHYESPQLAASTLRTNDEGIANPQGNRLQVNAVFSAYNVAGNAVASAKAYYREKGGNWNSGESLTSGVSKALHGNIEPTLDYEIMIEVKDSAGAKAVQVLSSPKGALYVFTALKDRAAFGCAVGKERTFKVPDDWQLEGGQIGGDFMPGIERATPFFYCGKRVYMQDFEFTASGSGTTSINITGAVTLVNYDAQAIYNGIAYRLPYITADAADSNAFTWNAGGALSVKFTAAWGAAVPIKGTVYYTK